LRLKTIKTTRETYPKIVEELGDQNLYENNRKLETQGELLGLKNYEAIEKYIIYRTVLDKDPIKEKRLHNKLKISHNPEMEIDNLYHNLQVEKDRLNSGEAS